MSAYSAGAYSADAYSRPVGPVPPGDTLPLFLIGGGTARDRTITLGWAVPPGSIYGYVFRRNGAYVSHTGDAHRTSVTYSHNAGDVYQVVALTAYGPDGTYRS